METRSNKRQRTAKIWSLLLPTIAIIFLVGIPSASSIGGRAGVYTEGADKLEIASDSAFTNPTTTFNAGDTG